MTGTKFKIAQGYNFDNVLLQDNQSAMKLENNGRASAGRRSRYLNIRYFFINAMKEKGHIKIEYCPTDKILGDYMSTTTAWQEIWFQPLQLNCIHRG
jgi:hypothetical protein